MKYKNGCPVALIHQGHDKPSNHRADDQLRAKVIEIISSELETIDDIIV
ncbi:MAG: hypothetical protein LBV23_05440 [Deltaproteobacteria bacterium]|nr:hypothetical protein [Deltaproteobacteria bacterium]